MLKSTILEAVEIVGYFEIKLELLVKLWADNTISIEINEYTFHSGLPTYRKS